MTNFDLTTNSLIEKLYTISMKVKYCIYQLIAKFIFKQQTLNQIRQFGRAYSNLTSFYQKKLKYFNDFQNQNFSVLLLKWTQRMEEKQNQIVFHGTYSNLMSYLFYQKILKYLNHFQNHSLSVLWLKWSQARQKRNKVRHLFVGQIQIWHHFSSVTKY